MHSYGDNSSASAKENIKCFSIGSPSNDKFAYLPNISNQEEDSDAKKNKQLIEWEATIYKIQGIPYAYRKETGEVYDLDSYRQKNPILVGHLTIKDGVYRYKKI